MEGLPNDMTDISEPPDLECHDDELGENEKPPTTPFVVQLLRCSHCGFETLVRDRFEVHTPCGTELTTYVLYTCSVCETYSTSRKLVAEHGELAHGGSSFEIRESVERFKSTKPTISKKYIPQSLTPNQLSPINEELMFKMAQLPSVPSLPKEFCADQQNFKPFLDLVQYFANQQKPPTDRDDRHKVMEYGTKRLQTITNNNSATNIHNMVDKPCPICNHYVGSTMESMAKHLAMVHLLPFPAIVSYISLVASQPSSSSTEYHSSSNSLTHTTTSDPVGRADARSNKTLPHLWTDDQTDKKKSVSLPPRCNAISAYSNPTRTAVKRDHSPESTSHDNAEGLSSSKRIPNNTSLFESNIFCPQCLIKFDSPLHFQIHLMQQHADAMNQLLGLNNDLLGCGRESGRNFPSHPGFPLGTSPIIQPSPHPILPPAFMNYQRQFQSPPANDAKYNLPKKHSDNSQTLPAYENSRDLAPIIPGLMNFHLAAAAAAVATSRLPPDEISVSSPLELRNRKENISTDEHHSFNCDTEDHNDGQTEVKHKHFDEIRMGDENKLSSSSMTPQDMQLPWLKLLNTGSSCINTTVASRPIFISDNTLLPTFPNNHHSSQSKSGDLPKAPIFRNDLLPCSVGSNMISPPSGNSPTTNESKRAHDADKVKPVDFRECSYWATQQRNSLGSKEDDSVDIAMGSHQRASETEVENSLATNPSSEQMQTNGVSTNGGIVHNTLRKTRSDMKVIHRYLVQVKHETRDIHMIPYYELDQYIQDFVLTAKKKDGHEYEPESLKAFVHSLERHLKNLNYPQSVLKGSAFTGTRAVLNQRLNELRALSRSSGTTNVHYHTNESHIKPNVDTIRGSSHFSSVTKRSGTNRSSLPVNLVQTGRLGKDSPQAILNSLWLINRTQFNIGGTQRHRNLVWGQFQLVTDDLGAKAIKFTPLFESAEVRYCRGYGGGRRSEFNGTRSTHLTGRKQPLPFDCVALFELYATLRPVEARGVSEPFYLCPESNWQECGSWFRTNAAGSQLIARIPRILGLKPATRDPLMVQNDCMKESDNPFDFSHSSMENSQDDIQNRSQTSPRKYIPFTGVSSMPPPPPNFPAFNPANLSQNLMNFFPFIFPTISAHTPLPTHLFPSLQTGFSTNHPPFNLTSGVMTEPTLNPNSLHKTPTISFDTCNKISGDPNTSTGTGPVTNLSYVSPNQSRQTDLYGNFAAEAIATAIVTSSDGTNSPTDPENLSLCDNNSPKTIKEETNQTLIDPVIRHAEFESMVTKTSSSPSIKYGEDESVSCGSQPSTPQESTLEEHSGQLVSGGGQLTVAFPHTASQQPESACT